MSPLYRSYVGLPFVPKLLIINILSLLIYLGQTYWVDLWRILLNFPQDSSTGSQLADLAPIVITMGFLLLLIKYSFPGVGGEEG